MDIQKILDYQKKDAELYKVEQKISNNPYRKKANELASLGKKSQTKIQDLENDAAKMLAEIEKITESYEINKKKAEELLNKKLDNLSAEDLEKLNSLKAKIVSNLNTLEKYVQRSAENEHRTISEYTKTAGDYKKIKEQYAACKENVEKETAALEPERKKIQTELAKLESSVDAKALAEYKKKRSEGIFPVYVALENDAFCGFCRMEQPKIALSKLKESGVITCEHCKRVIYK